METLFMLTTIILCGYLWRAGGTKDEWKWCRSVGVPATITLAKFALCHWNWHVLPYWVFLWLMLAGFSYGLGTINHRFWVWLFKKGDDGSCWVVEFMTRLTCGLMWSSAGWIFALATLHYNNFFNYQIIATMGIALIGSTIKHTPTSEISTGCLLATSILI